MQQQTNSSSADAPEKNSQPDEQRKKTDNQQTQDVDEKEDKENGDETTKNDVAEIHETVQGKKLEEKYRGGGTTDADEFKEQ